MLLTEISEEQLDELILDPLWVMEQKHDGTRGIAVLGDDTMAMLQRSGARLTHTAATQHLPKIWEALEPLAGALEYGERLRLDGEIMLATGEYRVFDLVAASPLEFWRRRLVLEMLWERLPVGSGVLLTRQARSREEKAAMLAAAEASGIEGVVLKHIRARYKIGERSASTLKFKFTKTADVVVMAVDRPDPKHGSFSFGIYRGGRPEPLGRCSAIGKPEAEVGDVIEVEYLYRQEGGSLVQPRMIGVRYDKSAEDCTDAQFRTYSRERI